MTHELKAIVFDVFGTVVDWRGSIAADLGAWGARHGLVRDWAALADDWRARYQPQMERVRSGAIGWTVLDALHRQALDELLPLHGLQQLGEEERRYINRVWHRLNPWSDVREGLWRLKQRHVIGTLSNGNVALLVNMAKQAGLPWDVVFSAESFQAYKPLPETYLGAARMLDLAPDELMLCAAHNDDLAAARAQGLRTAFVARPTEYGPHQRKDLAPAQAWDVVAADFIELADRLGA
ncbi:haloacid dehalogenase type II [Azohydromonas caseinilytica]|uniref:(S)-2-haloacid dehalogenase n=1 Tax=Azohydromonas caseinilytica TaxID=2728836 RepID=A0A848FHJ7_9BURK|nr:haloacid dehalogenase type II [Azohydromonas caseinilytica]NML17670.1 haloacid dehalogenase type II [Azohydromonas caseinilytica]